MLLLVPASFDLMPAAFPASLLTSLLSFNPMPTPAPPLTRIPARACREVPRDEAVPLCSARLSLDPHPGPTLSCFPDLIPTPIPAPTVVAIPASIPRLAPGVSVPPALVRFPSPLLTSIPSVPATVPLPRVLGLVLAPPLALFIARFPIPADLTVTRRPCRRTCLGSGWEPS